MARHQFSASTDIEAGDLVVALRDGARSPSGFPIKVPKKGMFYIVTGVYTEWYGLGCTLEGMNARPWKGFYLVCKGEHYFAKVEECPKGETIEVGLSQDVSVPLRMPEVA